jgi:hypothetical protein
MGIFDTRPRIQDRDFRQLSGDTIALSGATNISGSMSLIPGAVTGYVIKAMDSNGTFGWQPVSVSADTNTFVTGGTLTGNDLILSWNTGGSVSPVDLSGLLFTGNTSGNCITDLYITNLYGCSPITVHDNIQNNTSNANGVNTNAFGLNSTVDSDNSSILGGSGHLIDSVPNYSIVVGGYGNILSGGTIADTARFIGGGFYNKILDGKTNSTFIGGGFSNYINSANAGLIVGGYLNSLAGDFSLVVGGRSNSINGGDSDNSVIVGGRDNVISANSDSTIIGGGRGNAISGQYSLIVGGGYNLILSGSSYSVIGGGAGNEINYSSYSFIGGGAAHYINGGSYNVVGGGKNNDINTTSSYSTIIGGYNNIISHNNSHIIGSNLSTTQSATTFVENLDVSGEMVVHNSVGILTTDFDTINKPLVSLSGNSSSLIRHEINDGDGTGVQLGVRGSSEVTFPGFGGQGDGFVYAGTSTDGLNIINQLGSGKEDYIRFYAGQDASGSISDIHIQGSGSTRGFVGVKTMQPTSNFDIAATNGYEQLRLRASYTPTTSGDTNGNVGDVAWDDDYFYMKTNSGWGRTSLDYGF